MFATKLSYFTFILIALSAALSAQSFSDEVEKAYSPDLEAHSFSWHGGIIDNRSLLGLQLTYSFNATVAWRASNHLALHTSDEDDSSIKYNFSDVAASAFAFRTPLLFANILRTYVVSEINLNFSFDAKKISLAYSWRGGLEFYTSQSFSVFFEAGIQIPFYRQKGASVSSGGLLLLGGSYYF